MTVIVGVRCSDGIVIGADSAATAAMGHQHLMKLMSDKIFIVDNRVVVATTGSVGQAQRFKAVLEAQYKAKLFGKDCITAIKEIARETILDFDRTLIRKDPNAGWGLGAFVGGVFNDGIDLIEFPWTDFQPEIKKGKLFFGSMGSGQTLADPFLSFVARVMWENKQPTVDTARFGVHWALSHTIECSPGGVGHPIRLATISRQDGNWQCRLLEKMKSWPSRRSTSKKLRSPCVIIKERGLRTRKLFRHHLLHHRRNRPLASFHRARQPGV